MDIMMFHFEREGRTVLGFDTGLNERAFARTQAASLLTESGYMVSPDGSINMWNSEGVIELYKNMVIWGPDFEGTSLDALIQHDDDKDTALNALRSWFHAASLLAEKKIFPNPSPRGVFFAKDGTVFFPPSGLVKKCLDTEEDKSALPASITYLHPDLTESDNVIFCAAVMLYKIFSDRNPFSVSNPDAVRSNIREGNCTPIELASPGLDENIVQLINAALKPEYKTPSLIDLIDALGKKDSKRYSDFFRTVSGDEKESILLKQKQFEKRSQRKIRAKSFFHKNHTAIIGTGIGLALVIFLAWNIIVGQNNKPNTKGMNPKEIAERYYASFGILDHDFMEAAVTSNADKSDVDMVRNLFVISRVRQAYEMIIPVIPAGQWIEEGSPETKSMVFGVSGLVLTEINQSENEALLKAGYLLWMPKMYAENGTQDQTQETENDEENLMPVSLSYTSSLKFIRQKDVWRIAEIVKHEE